MKLSVVFSQEDLNALSQLLIERAEKIISNPTDDEKFYVSGCQAFLYFMKRDSGRMQKRMPLVLGFALEKAVLKLTPPKCSWNVDAFVYNHLLRYSDLKYGLPRMHIHNIWALRGVVLLYCLTTRNIFFMWYGADYQANLKKRISYIKSGLLSKAPVGLEEVYLPYKRYTLDKKDMVYNLNELMSVIYTLKVGYRYVSVSDIEKLKKSGVLADYLCCDKGKRYFNSVGSTLFLLPYPVNFFANSVGMSLESVVMNYSEISFIAEKAVEWVKAESILRTIWSPYLTLGNYVGILEMRYRDYAILDNIASVYGLSKDAIHQKLEAFGRLCLNGYSQSVRKKLYPLDFYERELSRLNSTLEIEYVREKLREERVAKAAEEAKKAEKVKKAEDFELSLSDAELVDIDNENPPIF